jgi:hypothetical protein
MNIPNDGPVLERRVQRVIRALRAREELASSDGSSAADGDRDGTSELLQQLKRRRQREEEAKIAVHVNTVGPVNGTTALVMVCTQGRELAVRALVEVGGADINLEAWGLDERDGQGGGATKKRRTPLIAAIQANHVEVVSTLLELGARVNLGTSDTLVTPLQVAVANGSLPIVSCLGSRIGLSVILCSRIHCLVLE